MATKPVWGPSVKRLKGLNGADVDAFTGRTALMDAAAKGNVECLNALIAAGADVDAKYDYGHTALMSRKGQCRVFERSPTVRTSTPCRCQNGSVGALMIRKGQRRVFERSPTAWTSTLNAAVGR